MTSRTHFTPNALLLILNLLHHATSLSSHSPPDPLAYPKYSVSLDGWDHAINNLTATAILNDLQSESKDDAISLLNYKSFDQNDQAELRHTLMRTASGQAFLCALPAIPSLAPPSIIASTSKSPAALPDLPSPETETEDLDRKKDRQKIEQDGLKNGLNLISSLKERCIYTRMGWFTYSFCYGKGEIKQFHAIMVPGFNYPQEDPTQDVYVLGFHLDHPQNPDHQAKIEGTLPAPSISAGEGELTSLGKNRFASGGSNILGSISDVLRDESVIKTSIEKEEEEFQQKRYLVQRWDGGTTCDMTGKPRSVEVQFHCSTFGSDHIALLRETSICEYLLVIHTPRLCSEPLFLDGGARKGLGAGEMVANIGCRPVLTNEEIENWKSSEQLRKQKEEEERLQKTHSLDENAQPGESLTPSDDDLKKPDLSSTSGQDSSVPKLDDPTADKEAPVLGSGNPDQTVLSDSDQTTGKKSEKAVELEIDPITVYFDADTGKMYMDKAAAEEARSSRSTTSAEGKTGAGSEAVGGTKSDSKTDQADSKKTSTHAPGNDLEEIAKALKESLGALLRDLKATENDENDPARRKHNPNQNNRVNNNIKPKSLAEVLAAFKSGDLKSSKLKGSNKNHLLQDQDGQDRSSARNEDHIKKLSSENHAKLRDMYQSTFSLKSSDSHLTSSDDKSDSKSDSDKDDE
ncbi:hypothetical protein Pst134EB_008115 [Puccinia striiformis f. sp. tritici]|nr:hypothetical protein Pst134EB_008115 [Puccinia striiformis f. sp. tritici]